jgi:hypothetical protein
MTLIPKTIFQIYHDKTLIQDVVKNDLMRLNPTYKYTIFDFNDGIKFVNNNFESQFAKKIITYLTNLDKYAHKSDLLRYCLLYKYGGVYIDVDLKQTLPLDLIINMSGNSEFITSFGVEGNLNKVEYSNFNNQVHPLIANGFLFSIPNNPILLELINHILTLPYKTRHSVNIYTFYKHLKNNCIGELTAFTSLTIHNISSFIFKEQIIIPHKRCGHEKYAFVNNDGKIIMYSNNYWDRNKYIC